MVEVKKASWARGSGMCKLSLRLLFEAMGSVRSTRTGEFFAYA